MSGPIVRFRIDFAEHSSLGPGDGGGMQVTEFGDALIQSVRVAELHFSQL
jgi:hypothetical protein